MWRECNKNLKTDFPLDVFPFLTRSSNLTNFDWYWSLNAFSFDRISDFWKSCKNYTQYSQLSSSQIIWIITFLLHWFLSFFPPRSYIYWCSSLRSEFRKGFRKFKVCNFFFFLVSYFARIAPYTSVALTRFACGISQNCIVIHKAKTNPSWHKVY